MRILGVGLSTVLALVAGAILADAGTGRGTFTIGAQGPLTIDEHVYSSILFKARANAKSGEPMQYKLNESGNTPPGMIFESYPCNKPGEKNCPELASADGIFLDGTPTAAGSYRFTITAENMQGKTVSQDFTVIVNPSRRMR